MGGWIVGLVLGWFVLCAVVVLEFSEVVYQFQAKISNVGRWW